MDEKERSDEQRRKRILKELAETIENKSNILIVLWSGSINIKCSAQTKNKAKLFRNDNNH